MVEELTVMSRYAQAGMEVPEGMVAGYLGETSKRRYVMNEGIAAHFCTYTVEQFWE